MKAVNARKLTAQQRRVQQAQATQEEAATKLQDDDDDDDADSFAPAASAAALDSSIIIPESESEDASESEESPPVQRSRLRKFNQSESTPPRNPPSSHLAASAASASMHSVAAVSLPALAASNSNVAAQFDRVQMAARLKEIKQQQKKKPPAAAATISSSSISASNSSRKRRKLEIDREEKDPEREDEEEEEEEEEILIETKEKELLFVPSSSSHPPRRPTRSSSITVISSDTDEHERDGMDVDEDTTTATNKLRASTSTSTESPPAAATRWRTRRGAVDSSDIKQRQANIKGAVSSSTSSTATIRKPRGKTTTKLTVTAATATKAKPKSKRKRNPSSSSQSSGDDEGYDSDYEAAERASKSPADSPPPTAASSKKKKPQTTTLRDMWSGSQGGSQDSQPSSSPPRYQLSLSQTSSTSGADRSDASPAGSATKPKKRYRSLIEAEQKDDGDEVIIVEPKPKIRTKSNTVTAAKKRAKLHANPTNVPRAKPTLNLTQVSNSSSSSSSFPSSSSSSSSSTSSYSGPPSTLWIDKYAPRNETDLCIHQKKVAEVKSWLQQFGHPAPPRYQMYNFPKVAPLTQTEPVKYGHGQKMLILTGPAGCGKSTLIRILAASLGYDILTWTNPTEDTFVKREDTTMSSANSFRARGFTPRESVIDQFRHFLLTSTRRSLKLSFGNNHATDITEMSPASTLISTGSTAATSSAVKKMVVLEEFPVEREDLRAEFVSILRSALPSTTSPLIFILTTEHESKSSLHDVDRTFGSDFVNNPLVHIIQCNPVSDTGLRHALDRVMQGEGIDLPDDVTSDLRRAANGDVRHAISSLQYQLVTHTAFNPTDGDVAYPSKQKRKRKVKTLVDTSSSSGLFTARDETFSVFHSVGKILYAKSSEHRLVHEIIESADVEPVVFMEWIYANYIDHLEPPHVPKPNAGFSTAAGKRLTSRSSKPASSSLANSASNPITLLSPPSFFDDDDMDGDAFDRVMSSATAGGVAAISPPPVDASGSSASNGVTQSAYNAAAFDAIVAATSDLSDADLLAAASRQEFGDSQSHVEGMQAAEVACRGYMLAKRSCPWIANPPPFKILQQRMQQKGPPGGKLRSLQNQKSQLFHQLFLQSYQKSSILELGQLMERMQVRAPTQQQQMMTRPQQTNLIQAFTGRDYLLPTSATFLDLLPYLYAISNASPAIPIHNRQQQQQQPQQRPNANHMVANNQNRAMMPPPPNRPPATATSANTRNAAPWQNSFAAPQSSPRAPIVIPYVAPKPTPSQSAFLRNINTYHPYTQLDILTKELDALQDQIRRTQALAPPPLPTGEQLGEIEEIDDD